jgi:hypothetical protein
MHACGVIRANHPFCTYIPYDHPTGCMVHVVICVMESMYFSYLLCDAVRLGDWFLTLYPFSFTSLLVLLCFCLHSTSTTSHSILRQIHLLTYHSHSQTPHHLSRYNRPAPAANSQSASHNAKPNSNLLTPRKKTPTTPQPPKHKNKKSAKDTSVSLACSRASMTRLMMTVCTAWRV